MLRRLLLCGTILVAAACTAESQLQYKAPDGTFSIRLPGAPTVENREGGAVVYKVADGDVTYVLRSMRTPAEFEADTSGERLYNTFQEGGVASLRGALQSQRAVVSGGQARTGREFVIHAETKNTGKPYEMTTRIFRVGPDAYVLTGTGPRDDSARRRIAAVLTSFSLLK